MKQLSVRTLEVKTIVPAEPTQPHNLFLTCFDIHMWHCPYMKRILFYPAREEADSSSFSQFVTSLCSSLERTLVLFYPYAGRMLEREDGKRPSVECNDAGVLFVTAEASISLEDLGPALDPNPDVFPDLIHCGTRSVLEGPRKLCDLPLLFIQVTRFLCGGISLGLAYNQVVSDGTAFWSFLRTWSEICGKRRVSMIPYHARDLLKVTDLTTEIDPFQFHSALYSFVDPWERLVKKHDKGRSARDNKPLPVVPLLEETQVHRMFFFPADTIQKLKDLAKSKTHVFTSSKASKLKEPRSEEEAGCRETDASETPERPSRGEFTSLEVLGAHLWRCTIKAQSPTGQSQTKFVIESDCRRRLPFLPDSFFGNAVCRTAAVTTVKELVEGSLYFAAKLIHKARRRSVSEQYIRTLVHFSEQRGNLRLVNSDPSRHYLTTAIQNSSKHPVYECDFGWGRPVKVRSGNLDDEKGAYAIFPGDPQARGSVEVGIVLPAGDMARLEQDPSFLLQH